MKRRMMGSAAFAVVCSVACSHSSGGPPPAPPIPRDQFIDRYAAASCDGLGRCCDLASLAFHADACVANATKRAHTLFDPAIANATSYDAQAAGDCVAAIGREVSACGVGSLGSGLALLYAPCERVFSGTVAAGATCKSSYDCAAPPDGYATCVGTGNGTLLQCVQLHPGHPGDPCEGPVRATCGGILGSGDLACNSSVYGGNDTCEPKRTAGQPCAPTPAIYNGYCTDDTACLYDPTSNSPSKLVCVARVAVGAACGGTTNQVCVKDAYCEAQKCAPLKGLGEACTSHQQCASYNCGPKGCTGTIGVDATTCGGM